VFADMHFIALANVFSADVFIIYKGLELFRQAFDERLACDEREL
jgi:hypothetical protein